MLRVDRLLLKVFDRYFMPPAVTTFWMDAEQLYTPATSAEALVAARRQAIEISFLTPIFLARSGLEIGRKLLHLQIG